MLKLLNDLLLSKRLSFNEGEIILLGTNICLIPPDVYITLLKELENNKNEHILYNSSAVSARKWLQNLVQTTNKKTIQELIDFVPQILNLLAFGTVAIVKNDLPNQTFEVVLDNSLCAELYGKSDCPIDLQFAGFLAGAFSVIFDKPMQCSEIACLAMGSPNCLFEVKPMG